MMTDTTDVNDLVKRATYALEDMQGRVDAGKLAMFADCIDRIESLAAKLAKVEAERDKWYKRAMEMVAERNDARDALPAVYRLGLEDAGLTCEQLAEIELALSVANPPYEEGYSDAASVCFENIRALPTPTAAELMARINEREKK